MIVKKTTNDFGDEVIFVETKSSRTRYEINHKSRQIWRFPWEGDNLSAVEITNEDSSFDDLLAEIKSYPPNQKPPSPGETLKLGKFVVKGG